MDKFKAIRQALIHVQSPIVIDREDEWVYKFVYEMWEHLWRPDINLTEMYFACVDAYSTYKMWNKDYSIEKFK